MTDDDDLERRHRELLPLHAIAEDAPNTIRRLPGRPRRARPAPTFEQQEYLAVLNGARDAHVARDHLVQASANGARCEQILRETIVGIAREAASLAFDIRQMHKTGSPTERLLSRRIDGLTKIASILLAQRRIGIEPELDRESPRMQRIIALWISTIREVAAATLPGDVAVRVVERVTAAMEAWEPTTRDIASPR